jgi:hypothetical protein
MPASEGALMRIEMRAVMAVAIAMVFTASDATEVAGRQTCRLWLAHMGRRSETSWTQIAAQQWLAGYLSGLAAGTGVDALKGVDMEIVYRGMDDFCRENPSLGIREGGDRIFGELQQKRAAK